MTTRETSSTDSASPTALLAMINSSWMSQAIYVAARLGLADLLAHGPRNSTDIARSAGAEPDTVHRLMRGLASLGLCVERTDGAFELTPLGNYLRDGVAGSVRSWALHWGGSLWPVWGTLLHSVKTGQSARPFATPKRGFDALARTPEAARIFNEAMADLTRLIAAQIVQVYDFARIGRIVDVGGGYGELLVAILRAHPAMHGTLFDLPHVVEGARRHIEAAGVADRCDVISGDVFEAIPAGIDTCLLKSVIHDWDDEHCHIILRNCRGALAPTGKLLLVERVLPDRMQSCPEHRGMAASDLNMLVAAAGRERTEAEYRALLRPAGFHLTRIVPVAAQFSLLEAECG